MLFKKWKKYIGKCGKSWEPRTFPLITLDDLPDFEECFGIDVNVFQMSENRLATPLYRSLKTHQEILNLNAFEQHLSYIKDPKMYCKKYECET